MSRVVEERIGVPGAALAGHNVPNAAPLEVAPAAGLLSYAMDPVYNFTSVTGYQNGLNDRRQYSTNARNQVTQAGNVMVEWDANGNMTSKSNGYTFKYDFNNRLREAVNPGGLTITYAYDPFNRRILKKLTTGPLPLTTVYVWDDQEVVEEYTKADTGSLQISKQYVPAQQIDQKISANADLNGDGTLETEYFYLQDQLGNVEAIVDGQGNKLEEYEMSGYGNARIYAPDSTPPQVEQVRTHGDGKLAVLFTEAVYPDTITTTNMVVRDASNNPAAGRWQLADGKREATFDGTLTNAASYTLSVSNVRDLALNQMAPYSKGFTMAGNTVLDDTKAPETERIWQSEGNVFVSFTEDLAAASIAADAVSIVHNALPVAGTTTPSDSRILQFTPRQPLLEDASYNLSVSASVSDLSGKSLTPDPQPLSFQYTPLPVAFYSRPDQRQERSTSAYKNFHLFQGSNRDPEFDLLYFRNRWLDPIISIWITKDQMEYLNEIYNAYYALKSNYANYIDPLGNWEKDIHYYAAYYLARNAGYDINDTIEIAWASQYVDDSEYINPSIVQSAQPWKRKIVSAYHFPAPNGQAVKEGARCAKSAMKSAMDTRSNFAFGIALHTVADTYAHAGFSAYHDPKLNQREGIDRFDALGITVYPMKVPSIGHAQAGVSIDYPYLHVNSAINTINIMYDYLMEYRVKRYRPPYRFNEKSNAIMNILKIIAKFGSLEQRIGNWVGLIINENKESNITLYEDVQKDKIDKSIYESYAKAQFNNITKEYIYE